MRVMGIDGCRGGWLAAVVTDEDVTWHWTTDVASLLRQQVDAVAIDMPIGLPERGRRGCDVEARRLLGPRRSTVFFAPPRPVLDAATYADARAVLAAGGEPSMSAQAYGIVGAVRAVDAALTVADEPRVVEAHPELAYLRMSGVPLASKKTDVGRQQRLRALAETWPDVMAVVAGSPFPARDDPLDALACAWTARRWVRGEALGCGDGARDRRGLLMRIVS